MIDGGLNFNMTESGIYLPSGIDDSTSDIFKTPEIVVKDEYVYFDPKLNYGLTQKQLEEQKQLAEFRQWILRNPVNAAEELFGIAMMDYQKYVFMSTWNAQFAVWCMARNGGKAVSLDTPIPLAKGGFKNMKDIQIGDYVLGDDGLPTKVINTSPIFYDHKCYRIHFSDNTSIDCDEEHIWNVYDGNKEYNLTVKELLKKESKDAWWSVKLNNPINYKERPVRSPNVDDDIEKLIEEYMFSSFKQRFQFLNWMVNVDKILYNSRKRNYRFINKSKDVVEKMSILISSLGYFNIISKHENDYICAFDVFHTKKHILDIKEIESVPTKCIYVDNPSHLYLCGKNYTVTHNSILGAIYIMLRTLAIEGHNSYILCGVGSQSIELFSKIEKLTYNAIPSFKTLTDIFQGEVVKSQANSNGFTHDPASYKFHLYNNSSVFTLNGAYDNNRSKYILIRTSLLRQSEMIG